VERADPTRGYAWRIAVAASEKSNVTDTYHLQRFVDAQRPIFEQVRSELRSGRKTTHWMWFVFPQIKGLGHSAMADKFAISSREEAEAYAAHTVLGPRLSECTQLVNAVEGKSIRQIFGGPDDLKFRSSMTLFAQVCKDNQIFVDAINKYFGGEFDPLTLDRL
jgi:uncharacterized protein (DUF1810 family)